MSDNEKKLKKTCEFCQFCHFAQCHRYPPVLTAYVSNNQTVPMTYQFHFGFPDVEPHSFCGEFQFK